MSPTADATVPRGRLGVVQGTALYIASVLGTGLLVLPGLAAEAAGPASIVAVLAVIGLSVPLAGTFAVLAARYPDPGGVASYARRALGGTAARMTGYWFLFGVCAGAPVVAVLGAEYVAAVAAIDRAMVPVVALAILVPPFAANLFGVRVAGWVQFVLTALLLAVVVGVVSLAAPAVQPQNFEPFLPHGWGGVGTAISLFVWAFAGWEVGTHISGEFRDPRRAIPIGTAIALVVTGVCYLVLQIVTVGALGDTAGDGAVPLLELARLGSAGFGPAAVGVIAAIVALGVMNAYLAAFAKLGSSLAANGDLPRWFAAGAESGAVPRRALALTGAVVAVYFSLMMWAGLDLTPFILVHTSSMVAIYAVGMVAAVRLLRRGTWGWWMAVVAAVLCAGMLVLAIGSLLPAALLAVAAIGVTVFRQVRIRRARRQIGDEVRRAGASNSRVSP
ncbi:APC family permease [Microbacterium allomyrinae]|jgi:amino acid efflux transporter|uniref:Amino acid permease n=1 Tax=Microbacterium allomyrinae TaxID=2830666 RepID=A0A9X1LWM3_9MICO|nr:amino acid permease [Microbacterium allomyrinae]MCC2033469.1 amino acid permease [Microbacterium allomyrinae]